MNDERGLLGYTGTWEGQARLGAGNRDGLSRARRSSSRSSSSSACKRLMRVGTCGGLQPHHALGDLIVALTAVPADATATHLVGGRAALPDRVAGSSIHGAVHAAKEVGQPMHVGPIVSSDVFYNPDEGQYERWSSRGVLAVEMEAAALFTVAAIGQGDGKVADVHGGCLLHRLRTSSSREISSGSPTTSCVPRSTG